MSSELKYELISPAAKDSIVDKRILLYIGRDGQILNRTEEMGIKI